MNHASTDVRSALDPASAAHISAWLVKLARLVRRQTGDADKEQIAEYVEVILRRELPKAAFNRDSLAYCVDGCEWWPAVSPLCERIEEHWQVQRFRLERDTHLRLSGLGDAGKPLTATEETWRRYWDRNEMTNWVNADEIGVRDDEIARRRKVGLSMVKQFAPKVWERVTGKSSGREDPADWHDAQRLRRTLGQTKGHPMAGTLFRCLHAAVKHNAPANLAMVEDAMSQAGVSVAPPKRGATA
ncbi:hypothetical protein [Kozakia baliensis]|uniref:hypothetical protein n=1 Tax=Kozakia baliensis TaxID=153496 RepID=UPI000496558B|nr:hypothetical protein [Kozakia baliensis]